MSIHVENFYSDLEFANRIEALILVDLYFD